MQTQVLCRTGQELRDALEAMAFSGLINTSFIERFNLTFRQMVASLSRKTWSLTQSHEKLLLHLEWSRAYYHFVRGHQSLSLDRALPRQPRERTPAMAAGLTGHRWRTLEILKMPLAAAGGG